MRISDIINNFKILGGSLVSVAILSACGDSVEDTLPPPPGSSITLSFNLDTFTTRGSGEAGNPDGHPEEGEIEGEINFHKDRLHVYVHDVSTDKLIFHINDATFSPLGTITKEKQADGSIKVKVNTRSLIAGNDYRISVMTNCQDKNGNLYAVDSSFQNDSANSTFLQNPHFMPYSGYTTFKVEPSAEEDHTQSIGDIWLLRSVARLEVVLSEDMRSKWKIEKAILPGFGQKLYGFSYASVPLGSVKEAKGTEYLTMQQMFNPHTVRMKATEDLEMGDVKNDGTYFRLYLPEQHNPLQGDSEEEIYVKLTLTQLVTGQTVAAQLYVRDNFAKPQNIVRNHIYRYTVKTVKPFFDVDVSIIQPEEKTIDVPPFN
ncbi:MAG: hypothetical protein K2O49_02335 [Muribaculaceae bacterium]|nr:hypothetical protein [Muribaculaceae bacterium]